MTRIVPTAQRTRTVPSAFTLLLAAAAAPLPSASVDAPVDAAVAETPEPSAAEVAAQKKAMEEMQSRYQVFMLQQKAIVEAQKKLSDAWRAVSAPEPLQSAESCLTLCDELLKRADSADDLSVTVAALKQSISTWAEEAASKRLSKEASDAEILAAANQTFKIAVDEFVEQVTSRQAMYNAAAPAAAATGVEPASPTTAAVE